MTVSDRPRLLSLRDWINRRVLLVVEDLGSEDNKFEEIVVITGFDSGFLLCEVEESPQVYALSKIISWSTVPEVEEDLDEEDPRPNASNSVVVRRIVS